MFWRKEKKPDLVLIVFGLIAFGIIMSVSILIFKIFSQRTLTDSSETMESTEMRQSDTDSDSIVSFATEEVEEKYNQDINDLYLSIDSNDSTLPDLLTQVEEQMLKIKVPSSLRQSYLEAVLMIVKLQDEMEIKLGEDIKSDLLSLLQNLKTK